MGLFDIFKSNKKKVKDSSDVIGNTSKTVPHEIWSDDLCSANAQKKHFLMYILTEPQSCFFICMNLKENEEANFMFKEQNLSLMNQEDIIPSYIFTWIINTVRNNQEDFTRVFEILDRSHLECYSSTLLMTPEELVARIRYYFPNFSLGNDPNHVKTALEWTFIDICVLKKFLLEMSEYVNNHLSDTNIPVIEKVSDCNSLEDLLNYNIGLLKSILK